MNEPSAAAESDPAEIAKLHKDCHQLATESLESGARLFLRSRLKSDKDAGKAFEELEIDVASLHEEAKSAS